MTIAAHAVIITAVNQPGVLSEVTRVLAKHGANISHVDIIPSAAEVAQVYFEFTLDGQTDHLCNDLKCLHPAISILRQGWLNAGLEFA